MDPWAIISIVSENSSRPDLFLNSLLSQADRRKFISKASASSLEVFTFCKSVRKDTESRSASNHNLHQTISTH